MIKQRLILLMGGYNTLMGDCSHQKLVGTIKLVVFSGYQWIFALVDGLPLFSHFFYISLHLIALLCILAHFGNNAIFDG